MKMQSRQPVHPGDILLNHYIKPLNISLVELSNSLCISKFEILDIIYDHKPITIDIALRLSKMFNTSQDLWINLQKNYDLANTKRQYNNMDFTFTDREKIGVFQDPRIIDLVMDYHEVCIAEGEAIDFNCSYHYNRLKELKKLRSNYNDILDKKN